MWSPANTLRPGAILDSPPAILNASLAMLYILSSNGRSLPNYSRSTPTPSANKLARRLPTRADFSESHAPTPDTLARSSR